MAIDDWKITEDWNSAEPVSTGYGSKGKSSNEYVPQQSRSTESGSKESDPAGRAPQPEINPLLNPLLEQNLGRWARIYFSNPPETRNQKVMELLRELEDQASSARSSNPVAASSAKPKDESRADQNDSRADEVEEKVACSVCQSENQAEQRFCGACGSRLRPAEPSRRADPLPSMEPRAEDYEDYSSDPVATHSFLGLSPIPRERGNDVQFLRDKAYAGAYDYEPTSHRGRYLVAGLVILLAGMAYYWDLPGRLHLFENARSATTSAAPAQKAPSQVPSTVSVPAEPAQPSAQVPESSDQPTSEAAPETSPQTQPEASSEPAKQSASLETLGASAGQAHKTPISASLPASSAETITLDSSRANPPTDDGAEELLLAQRYLAGQNAPRDTALAAKWLWKAVAKQNSRAGVLLADLYARGDGVSKSCDQARLLLMAALKKGASDAAPRLRELESGGCR